jgi:hypothetical protein
MLSEWVVHGANHKGVAALLQAYPSIVVVKRILDSVIFSRNKGGADRSFLHSHVFFQHQCAVRVRLFPACPFHRMPNSLHFQFRFQLQPLPVRSRGQH